MSPGLLVVQHEQNCPPGWFGSWLQDAGLSLEVLPAHEGHAIPAALDGHSGLLVLGGEMGANDDATVPWLAPLKALIATTVAARMPMLGLCLGHQLATVALGGVVVPNPFGHARGLTPYRPNPAGVTDPLLSAVTAGAPAVQWNADVVTELPDGATELATSPDGTVQAARYGERAWGVQFHPECSPAIFNSWTVDKPSANHPSGIDVATAAADVERAAAQLRAAWEPLARRFAGVVHQTHGPDASW